MVNESNHFKSPIATAYRKKIVFNIYVYVYIYMFRFSTYTFYNLSKWIFINNYIIVAANFAE